MRCQTLAQPLLSVVGAALCLLLAANALGQLNVQDPIPNRPELSVQLGHPQMLVSLAISSDSRLVVTGGYGGAILWHVPTRAQIRHFNQPGFLVVSVAFSTDNKYVATGGTNLTVGLWDVRTGQQVRSFIGHNKAVTSVALSPNGLLLTSSMDNTARLWDVATGKERGQFKGHKYQINAVAFSDDGRWFLTGGADGVAILRETATGKDVKTLRGHTDWISAVRFSRDNSVVLTAGSDGTARLWDFETGRPIIVTAVKASVLAATLSADGQLILTGHEDRVARLWDAKTGTEVMPPLTHKVDILAVAFSNSGQFIVTGSTDGLAHVWGRDGKDLGSFGRISHPVRSTIVSPDGRYLITGSENGIAYVWDFTAGRVVHRLRHPHPVRCLAVSPDGQIVAVASDRLVALWNAATGKLLYFLDGHNEPVHSVAFSPKTGRLLLTGSGSLQGRDNSVRVWETETGKQISYLGNYLFRVNAVAFSPDERLAIAGSWSGDICLWDLPNQNSRKCFDTPGYVSAVAFSPDGSKFLTGHMPEIWETEFVPGEGLRVKGSVDLQKVRQRAKANVARLWETATQKEIRSFDGYSSVINAVAFSPDGRQVLLALSDFSSVGENTVRMFDAATGNNIRQFRGHKGGVDAVSFLSDSRFVSASLDGTIRFWDTTTGEHLAQLLMLSDDSYVVVDPSGRFDTNRVETIKGLSWIMPDDPLTALPIEIFMRDYYQPRLLERTLRGEKLGELRPLIELNRIQPEIGKIIVNPKANNPELVDVTVEVKSEAMECPGPNPVTECESGVYDLRLYRDGQLVGRFPKLQPDADHQYIEFPKDNQLSVWRQISLVTDRDGSAIMAVGGPKEITFTDIRLPQRSSVSQVEFTAYAFNKDRVKSATSERAIYKLPQSRPAVRRRAFVITVGIDATSDPSVRLGFAPQGAREIEALLKQKLSSEYELIPVQLISEYKHDEGNLLQPTKANIRQALNILAGQEMKSPVAGLNHLRAATPDDLVLLYIASHGYVDPNGKFYVIPADIGEPAGISELKLDRCLESRDQSKNCQESESFFVTAYPVTS